MIYVKICGITRAEDARSAALAGANAIGFVFHSASPRAVAPERAGEIAAALPPGIDRIGVFVDETAARIEAIARQAGLTHVQLHGSESPAFARGLSMPVLKAIRLRDERDLVQLDAFAAIAPLMLVDAWVPDRAGGTGVVCDWALAARAAAAHPILLAGGLSADNVTDALRRVRPLGVDASSSLEFTPGVKNPDAVRAFVHRVRECERATDPRPVLER